MPGKILVVDDIATDRGALKVKLSSAAYRVSQAGSGAEALGLAAQDRPDLILLDAALPDMDGLEACRRLKGDRRTAQIPVIMLTSQSDIISAAARIAALEVGAEDLISRPLGDLALLARVRSILRARGIAAELALREGTRQALGFAEPVSDFVAAGRICLVAADETAAESWRRGLVAQMHDRIEVCTPTGALQKADKLAPDLFVVSANLARPGEGLMLLSELRSRLSTRHAGIIVVVDSDAQASAAMALDMGASDIVTLPLDFAELTLRLRVQLARKRQGDRLRSRVRDGLQMAVTDPLTGLYNRRYAMSHLARVREQAVTTDRSFAVMLIDLDNFKQVNDTYGHTVGDMVLKSVAETLGANLRSVDLVARIGGEEFLAILPNTLPEAALKAAERLRLAVCSKPIDVAPAEEGAEPLSLIQTISIGLVTSDGAMEAGVSLADLLQRADQGLYCAKKHGRNRVSANTSGRAAA